MRKYILTGTPGSGKTAILRQLETDGFSVVEEAATDVIALQQARGVAEPWTDASFIDAVVELQTQRELRAATMLDTIQFHDRSVVCTAALATYLEFPYSPALECALERIAREKTFEKEVLFIRNLGSVVPTDARRISYEEALRFERVHEEVYQRYGFGLISIDPGSPEERVAKICEMVGVMTV
jgi:predicted ATPase